VSQISKAVVISSLICITIKDLVNVDFLSFEFFQYCYFRAYITMELICVFVVSIMR